MSILLKKIAKQNHFIKTTQIMSLIISQPRNIEWNGSYKTSEIQIDDHSTDHQSTELERTR